MFGTWLGFILLFAVFGLFVWVVMGIMPRTDDYERKRALARVEKLKVARDEDNAALNGYAWVDKAKGTVRVPIQRAMELTVAELAQKKPAAANPIAPEVQPVPQATATPAAPSPPGALRPLRPQPGVEQPGAPPGTPLPVPEKQP
jgi:hypothetical protein